MKLSVEETNGVAVIRLDEQMEIDVGNAGDFKEQSVLGMGDRGKVVLDASDIQFFDSAGMGALLSIKKKALENGGDLVLSGLRQTILDIFQIVGFDTIFKIFPDVPAALSHYDEG